MTGITKSLYKGIWEIAYSEYNYCCFQNKVSKRGRRVKVFDKTIETIYASLRSASIGTNVDRNLLLLHLKTKNDVFNINNYTFTILD